MKIADKRMKFSLLRFRAATTMENLSSGCTGGGRRMKNSWSGRAMVPRSGKKSFILSAGGAKRRAGAFRERGRQFRETASRSGNIRGAVKPSTGNRRWNEHSEPVPTFCSVPDLI